MFDLILSESAPPEPVRRKAVAMLAGIVKTQASLACGDVQNQRNYLRSKLQSPSRGDFRMVAVDLERAEALLGFFAKVTSDPEAEATARLDSLLQLLDGPVCRLELAPTRLAAEVRPEYVRGRRLRMLLVPDALRRRRIQIQELDPEGVQPPLEPAPRCYGETGHAYMGWALNRMDLRSLLLSALAYLRDN